MKENKEDKLNIELTEEVAEGTYSNLAIITHSSSEFIVDFVSIMPGTPKANVKSRIILTPQNAKRLMNALQDNMNKYEAKFGTVVDKDANKDIINIPFSGPAGQA